MLNLPLQNLKCQSYQRIPKYNGPSRILLWIWFRILMCYWKIISLITIRKNTLDGNLPMELRSDISKKLTHHSLDSDLSQTKTNIIVVWPFQKTKAPVVCLVFAKGHKQWILSQYYSGLKSESRESVNFIEISNLSILSYQMIVKLDIGIASGELFFTNMVGWGEIRLFARNSHFAGTQNLILTQMWHQVCNPFLVCF